MDCRSLARINSYFIRTNLDVSLVSSFRTYYLLYSLFVMFAITWVSWSFSYPHSYQGIDDNSPVTVIYHNHDKYFDVSIIFAKNFDTDTIHILYELYHVLRSPKSQNTTEITASSPTCMDFCDSLKLTNSKGKTNRISIGPDVIGMYVRLC